MFFDARLRIVQRSLSWLLAGLLLLVFALPASAARNVILLVSDGAGYNTWIAASMYRGRLGEEVYDADGWVHFACSTHPLNLSKKPTGTGEQDPKLVYDPSKAWDATPVEKGGFAAYALLARTATDSAASGTALATGVKTYNNGINWTDDDRPLAGRTIAERAKAAGKAVGTITSVQFSHATPATLGGAHSRQRDAYAGIANKMLYAPYLDVIMGAGHPHFGNDGRRRDEADFDFVGGRATWRELRAGTHPAGWTLVETKADFEALRSGPTPPKVLGVPRVATTLQQGRPRRPAAAGAASNGESDEASSADDDAPYGAATPPAAPFHVPMNQGVPSLETMTAAALNCLADAPDGFYLAIEGGAVDWANHANQADRMIEEQIDFLKAVETVVAWVETHSSWDETLVIITADHECGLLWGPNSDTVAFDPVVDRGKGNLPAMRFNSRGHTNSLVPIWARGPGSERFDDLVVGVDEKAAAAWKIDGRYVDNTAVFAVMDAAIAPPQPAIAAGAETVGAACHAAASASPAR